MMTVLSQVAERDCGRKSRGDFLRVGAVEREARTKSKLCASEGVSYSGPDT
jgi:hypothetical protein